jgi:peptide/nickel transport system permease protein
LLQAFGTQDLYVYTGFIAMSLFLLIVGNIISDILLAVVDPRIRYG